MYRSVSRELGGKMQIRTPWRAVAAMFMLCGVFTGIWSTRIPALADGVNASHDVLGQVLLCMGIGAIASFSFASILSDKIGAAKASLWLMIGYFAFFLGLPLVGNVWQMAVVFGIFGVFHGMVDVCMNAWAAEVEKHMKRSVMSSFHAMFSLGAGVGAASAFLAVKIGLSLFEHFLIGAGLCLVLLLPFSCLRWESERSTGARGPLFVFPRGALLLVGLFSMSSAIGEGAMGDWSAIFLREAKGASEARAALGFTAFNVMMVVVRLLGQFAVSRFGPVLVARISGMVAVFAGILVINADSITLAIFGFGLMGLAYALIVPLAFTRAGQQPGISTGRAIAGVATLAYGGLLMGPPVIGFVAEAYSLEAAFMMIVGLGVVTIGLAGTLKTPE